ncbi:MAG TPA: DNA-binding response regulator [Eubacterium sp.]|nr:DNA-binding response regulator [Eubacterium sp.]
MKIIIVDDDKLVATSLKMIVESDKDIEVLAIGNSGEEAIKLFDEYKPDVLLMDIRMDGLSGLDAGEEILNKNKDAKILYLTTFNDEEYIDKALSIGAKGYIIKQDFEGIVPSLKTVFEGNMVFGKEVTEKIVAMSKVKAETDDNKDVKSSGEAFSDLTSLELEIVKCVAKGENNKEIATSLCLSEGTVRNYLSNILAKLDIRDRTNLAIFYLNNK